MEFLFCFFKINNTLEKIEKKIPESIHALWNGVKNVYTHVRVI